MGELKNDNKLSVTDWCKEVFFAKRMNSVPGLIVMAIIGIGLAWLGTVNEKLPLVIAVLFVAILFVLVCLRYPEVSYYAYVYSIIIFTLPARMFGINIPLGMLLEPTGYLAVISILASQYRKRQNSAEFWKTPISLMMLVLFCFYLLEGFNPEINGREGWFKFFRKQICIYCFYYVSFLMLDSLEKIRRFVKLWIILAIVVALWGIKQQWFGFTAFEDAWIHSDPNITTLLFQGGMFRKFSLLPDPASFGVMAASLRIVYIGTGDTNTYQKKKKLVVILLRSCRWLLPRYSGTRTCNVMLIGGLLAYIVFTLNEKRTIIVLISSVAIAVFLLFGPLQNSPVIYRIKTTFDGSKEPSNMVRDVNRKNIQPYIYEHPLGGGLNTCGEEGAVYYPGHRLAGYPPDSGYMKIMLEQGWVGLAINILFYFIILYSGITGFYNSRREEIKTYYIAFTVCFFSLVVGQYSQLAISQYPQYLFYLATLVIFYKLKEYDTKNPETS